ncbi:hypothetical protein, partial [Escherichia coli]|uniref:hypothetical protein n=1 Tax=Escherichia coli TaxID=562 RepID=UPI0019D6744A
FVGCQQAFAVLNECLDRRLECALGAHGIPPLKPPCGRVDRPLFTSLHRHIVTSPSDFILCRAPARTQGACRA